LAIEPISVEEICRMNKEFLEPIINNSEFLYILWWSVYFFISISLRLSIEFSFGVILDWIQQ